MILAVRFRPVLVTVVALLQVSFVFHQSNAFPQSAGGCEGGQAAVAGSHVMVDNVVDGTLGDGYFVMSINGERLRSNVPMEVPIGVNNVWEISGSNNNNQFRGFLVRLDGGRNNIDTISSLQAAPGHGGSVQVAETVCVNVYGVGGATHRSRAFKSGVSGILFLEETSSHMMMDVTIVVENRGQNSEYYYSSFILHAIEASATEEPTQPLLLQDEDEDENVDDDLQDEDEGPGRATPRPTPRATPRPSPRPTPRATPKPTPRPTSRTTPRPTPRPPPFPTNPATNDDGPPLLENQTPQCTRNRTCGICSGDCDNDLQCTGSLACFQRDDWDLTPVPGCQGQGIVGSDYCFDPIAYPYALQEYPDDCTVDFPCEKCKGECRNDEECAGDLECFQRPPFGNSTIPGCYGLGRAGKNYCFDRADLVDPEDEDSFLEPTPEPPGEETDDLFFAPTPAPPAEEEEDLFFAPTPTPTTEETSSGLPLLESVTPQCSLNNTCGICGGDCDSDLECTGRLACFQRDDWDYTPVPGCEGDGLAGMDYCFDPIAAPFALQTYPEDCSDEFPCAKCKGDCDNDNECAGSLECFQRPPFGNSTVPGCYGRGWAGSDYCFDRRDMVDAEDEIPRTPAPTEEDHNQPTWEPTLMEEDEIYFGTWAPTFSPTKAPTFTPETDPPTVAPVEPVVYSKPTYAPTDDSTHEGSYDGTFEGSYEGTNAYDVVVVDPEGDDQYSNANNPLVYAVCSFSNPCGACNGDCDFDSQCQDGLECYPRRKDEFRPVPGCSGLGFRGHDYCYAPDKNAARPRITPCSPQSPCMKCQGDCDTHADCAGNLVCFHRFTGDSPWVPGCNGDGLGNVDYCIDPNDHPFRGHVDRNVGHRNLRLWH